VGSRWFLQFEDDDTCLLYISSYGLDVYIYIYDSVSHGDMYNQTGLKYLR